MQTVWVGVSRRVGIAFISAALGVVACQRRVRADTLTLDGASPAGTVVLSGSELPPAYNPVNVYAGVLDWTSSTGTKGVPNVWTYCVDVAAIINTGNNYSFNQGSLNFSPTIVNAIEWLWNDSTFVNPVTHVSAGTINTQSSVNQIGAEYAAMFQVALWDIIYNAGASNPTVPTNVLAFSSPGNGLSSTDLTNALNAASNDYQDALNHGAPTTNVPELSELLATSGQNQVIFLGLAPAPTLPVPKSFVGGLVLLGLLGVGSLRRKANALSSSL